MKPPLERQPRPKRTPAQHAAPPDEPQPDRARYQEPHANANAWAPDPNDAPLANANDERFAQLVAAGANATQAYRDSHPTRDGGREATTAWVNASQHKTKVKQRIAAIQRAAAHKAEWSIAEKLAMLAERGRKAYKGMSNIMTVGPDGQRTIELHEGNADVVRRAKARIAPSGTGDGSDDSATILDVEVENWLDSLKEHSRLAGHYPEQRLAAGADSDGRQRDTPQILVIHTHATTGIDPDLDAYIAQGAAASVRGIAPGAAVAGAGSDGHAMSVTPSQHPATGTRHAPIESDAREIDGDAPDRQTDTACPSEQTDVGAEDRQPATDT